MAEDKRIETTIQGRSVILHAGHYQCCVHGTMVEDSHTARILNIFDLTSGYAFRKL